MCFPSISNHRESHTVTADEIIEPVGWVERLRNPSHVAAVRVTRWVSYYGNSALNCFPHFGSYYAAWLALPVSSSPITRTTSPSAVMAKGAPSSARATMPFLATCRRKLPRRRGRGVGLMPDAEPRASYPGALRPGRDAPRIGAGASRLCRHHPGAAQAQRPFLAGPVRRRRDG